ncbi:phage distal tail protein [Aeromicrobium endophyticum]|uniref:Siphovirus-type tail component C-terminal domain-containing protein n=1 Tax=Aeromicrobium endophyticum TaxID=2292704 RepID=A0A371PE02_9ACTN|nr:phage tail domain-containing protein [Aeromicrobium endophyticum]REK73640.1 hypothetical protein DX116_08930 [Aeromicrobium endophyticum]
MTTAQLGDSGITIGETDSFGCRWGWSGDSPDPWSPSPSPRDVTGENATTHGAWDATEFYGPRTFSLEGFVVAPSHEALHQAKTRFWAACGLRPFELRIIEPGYDRFATMRRGGEPSWKEISPESPARANFSVPLWGRDPRLYSTVLHTASTRFPTTTGGLEVPLQVPFELDAVATSGEMNLQNTGSEDAWPVYRIDPANSVPVVDPVIVEAATGRAMRFKLTINPGDWVTIDTRNHLVLGNGEPGASRRSSFYGDWLSLEPGASKTIRYAGASGDGSTLSAAWRMTDI